jgi:RNA polymerase sigma-54 factor
MELKQFLKMQQQLVMTPQLQQAIKLLQLSRAELAETVQQELLENPVLEIDGEARSSSDIGDSIDAAFEKDKRDAEKGPEAEFDMNRFIDDYAEYASDPASRELRLNDDELPTLEQTVASRPTLADHLDWQLKLVNMTDEEREIADAIVGNLNGDGYIQAEQLEAIAAERCIDLSDVESVLVEIIQDLDPLGVGARSLKEGLLIQARTLFPRDDLIHNILERHLENFEKRAIAVILKDLDCDAEDLQGAMKLIRELEPKPGRNFSTPGEEPQYVTPDVYIVKVGRDYLVQLNDDGLPRLKLSRFYQRELKRSTGMEKGSEEREFLQNKFKSAMWLIRSIHQRQSTIRKVAESLSRFQRDFLDKGPEHLRPLILRDVADDIGMHESTVSRVTTNKYVQTPQGIFELKYFFNSRISSTEGADLASESVKQKIRKFISHEDPKKPLSDQKLCDMLEAEGMSIARRTVAKYREMMGIATSQQRRQMF